MERRGAGKKTVIVAIVIVLAALLLFPLILVGGIFSCMVAFLNPVQMKTEQTDAHYKALQAVSAEYSPENSIDVYIIKAIDLMAHDKITENQGKIERFIEDYFLLELEREVSTTEVVDGEEVTHTTIEIYYRYKEFYEIVSTVRAPPFRFKDGEINTIVNLSMAGIVFDFNAGAGETVGGASPPGGMNGTLMGRYPAPIQGGVITCGYINRINPISGKQEFHPALDIQAEWHAPITTIADGVVVTTNTKQSPYGNYVVIKHELPEETFYTKYAHLSQIKVTVGQTVAQGELVGIEGGDPRRDPNPGWTTGHHLHLEIWTDQGHVNPAHYIY